MLISIHRALIVSCLFLLGAQLVAITPCCMADDVSVFKKPALAEASLELQSRAILLAKHGQMESALMISEEAVNVAPFSWLAHYNLACFYAQSGKEEESLKSIKYAINLGFREEKLLENDDDLKPLRDLPEFKRLLEETRKPSKSQELQLSPFQDNIAWVGAENTIWDESINLLRTGFEWKRPARPTSVILEHGELGNRLRKWFIEGTAAGHFGDLYDNCDRDHSNLRYSQFPQLHRIEYQPEIIGDISFGLQNRFLHGGVVLGNSSTSLVNVPIWRSNPRRAYVTPPSMGTLARHYSHNHLYVYPEHQDHDPGRNGTGGYGDVYPANTPYLLISQGSSYTDQPFLDALACTMASFRPEVKEEIVKLGLMAPTLQQIFRSCYKPAQKQDAYLTGIAHPSVFDGTQIDAMKMVEVAHSMKMETIPPLARLHVEQQEQGHLGQDYFDVVEMETLFDTPNAVARIGRSMQFDRRMIVTARESFDHQNRPLKFKWVVLRGDESRIRIQPLDDEGSRADITVGWHPRRKIHPDSPIESNRVDIGLFANNGKNWSAPAFITWYFLDNEEREYDDKKRILSVEYHGGTDEGNYVDPLIQIAKTWKDTYHYTEAGEMIGWTRSRGVGPEQKNEEFTRDGFLVLKKDDLGRAVVACGVQYEPQPVEGKPFPTVGQTTRDDLFRYSYEGPQDKLGKITSQEIKSQ